MFATTHARVRVRIVCRPQCMRVYLVCAFVFVRLPAQWRLKSCECEVWLVRCCNVIALLRWKQSSTFYWMIVVDNVVARWNACVALVKIISIWCNALQSTVCKQFKLFQNDRDFGFNHTKAMANTRSTHNWIAINKLRKSMWINFRFRRPLLPDLCCCENEFDNIRCAFGSQKKSLLFVHVYS